MPDYNLWLAIAIWAFFLLDLLVPLGEGQGLLYLGRHAAQLGIPSWRARFNRHYLLVANPLRSLAPVIRIELLGARTDDTLRELFKQQQGYRWLYLWISAVLLLVSLQILILLPLTLLLHAYAGLLLLPLGIAYACYLLALAAAQITLKLNQQSLTWQQWGKLLSPLLCIPQAPHALRKLSLCLFQPMSMIDLLQSPIELDSESLRKIKQVIMEYRELNGAEDNGSLLVALESQIKRRMKGKENE